MSSGFTIKKKEQEIDKRKRWKDNIKEWTGMGLAFSTRAAEDGKN
ncbi:MAG: hypothetical protein AB2693_31310 [Candidatus Thiodiazotropha sp.]